jgi:hypothetical protein
MILGHLQEIRLRVQAVPSCWDELELGDEMRGILPDGIAIGPEEVGVGWGRGDEISDAFGKNHFLQG